MSPILIVLTGPVIALLLLSAMASAVETALFSLDENRRKGLRRKAPDSARELERLLEDPRKTVHALLLGDSFLNFLLIFLSLLAIHKAPFLEGFPSWAAAAVVFSTLVLFCELIPKLLALQFPIPVLAAGTNFAIILVHILGPLAKSIQKLAERIVDKPSQMLDPEAEAELGREELIHLLEIGGREGSIFPAEAKLLKEVVKLGGENVTHCMTPRVDMFSIPDDLDNNRAITVLQTRRYHRVPVYGQIPDDVLGVLDVRKFLQNPDRHYTETLIPPSFVPGTMDALSMLQSFLQRKKQFAILLDEYGGIVGITTLSDMVDELVGEEGAGSSSGSYIEELSDGTYLVGGGVMLDDLHEVLGWASIDTDSETLGGLIAELHGSIPRPGSVISFNGWSATVRRASRKRIKEVILSQGRIEVQVPESRGAVQ